MSIQIAPDGRRILWLAHESAPKNFTAVDVSDPRKPKVVVQTDLPQAHMRSNSLETCGNMMAVAYQTQKKGQQPAGMELFDISVPEKPQVDLVLRLLGRDLARRAPALVLRRRIRPHARRARPTSSRRIPTTTSSTAASTCAIRRSRSSSAAGDMPGTKQGDNVMPPPRHPARQGPPRPQQQRLSAAAGPLLPRLYRRRHVRARHLRQGQPEARSRSGPTRRPIPASCTRWCRCSTAG